MEKEKPATADIAYATIDFSKNEEPNESSLGTATSKQKDSNEDVLYAEVSVTNVLSMFLFLLC